MAMVWIPALYRDLTDGKDRLTIDGSTVREVVDNLDNLYPGIKDRLLIDNNIRNNISVLIDGEVSYERLRHKVSPDTEISFVPAIAGG